MKVIANLGKLNDQHTALIIDNEYFPYYIVNGYNGKTEGGDLWAWTVAYYDKLMDFAKAITNYDKSGIGWYRMSEIASMAIDGLVKDDPYEAREYLENEIELSIDEALYFGVGELLEMVQRQEEE